MTSSSKHSSNVEKKLVQHRTQASTPRCMLHLIKKFEFSLSTKVTHKQSASCHAGFIFSSTSANRLPRHIGQALESSHLRWHRNIKACSIPSSFVASEGEAGSGRCGSKEKDGETQMYKGPSSKQATQIHGLSAHLIRFPLPKSCDTSTVLPRNRLSLYISTTG